MRLALYESEKDNRPDVRDLAWHFVARLLTSHRTGPCDASTCIGKKCGHKYGQAWSPVDIEPGATRANRNVRAITAAVFDLDDVVSEEWETRIRAAGLQGVIHSTHTSHEGACYLRLVLTLSRPVCPSEWPIVWAATIERFGLPADPACGDPARLYFTPSAPAGAPVIARILEGVPLDVDALLSAVGAEAITPRANTYADLPQENVRLERSGDRPPASADVRAAALRAVMALGQAVEWKGGDALTYRAAVIAANDFALSEDEALDVLSRWDAFNEPPWGADGLAQKLEHASRYAAGETGAARAARETKAMMLGGGPAGSALGLPEPEPEPEPGTFPAALRDARALVANALGLDRVADVQATPMFESVADLMARKPEPPRWLVKSLILEGGVAVIATEPKAAKTWAATEIAIGVSTGTLVFGRFPATRGRVAYFYAEDLDASVVTRFGALIKSRGLSPADLSEFHAQPRGRELDLCNDDHLALLLASCRMLGPLALLVLDPLRNIHTGEEDSSDAMSKVMARLRFLSSVLGCTVLFVHHSKKQNADSKGTRQGQMMRGSSAIHGAVDSGIYFSNLKVDGADRFTNSVHSEVKGAKGAGFFQLTLAIRDENESAVDARWTVDSHPNETKAEAKAAERDAVLEGKILVELRKAGLALDRSGLFKRVGGNKQNFLDAVRDMRDSNPPRIFEAHGQLTADEVRLPTATSPWTKRTE